MQIGRLKGYPSLHRCASPQSEAWSVHVRTFVSDAALQVSGSARAAQANQHDAAGDVPFSIVSLQELELQGELRSSLLRQRAGHHVLFLSRVQPAGLLFAGALAGRA